MSGKHYANHVPDELFQNAAQKAAQQAAAIRRSTLQNEKGGNAK